MSRNQLAQRPTLDPEFEAVYQATNNVPRSAESKADTADSERAEEDSLLALKRIAEQNKAEYVNRKEFADGSFDQVEHDVSNAVRIGWNFLTRE